MGDMGIDASFTTLAGISSGLSVLLGLMFSSNCCVPRTVTLTSGMVGCGYTGVEVIIYLNVHALDKTNLVYQTSKRFNCIFII